MEEIKNEINSLSADELKELEDKIDELLSKLDNIGKESYDG